MMIITNFNFNFLIEYNFAIFHKSSNFLNLTVHALTLFHIIILKPLLKFI